MNLEERKRKIYIFRNVKIVGKCLDMVPATEEYAEKIVHLRNKPDIKYWFNQDKDISLETQIKWLESYKKKENDLYWCLLKHDGTFLGTIRLYNIDLNGEFCEEGSYVINSDYSEEAPYSIEAKMLALDIAFRDLEIKFMVNQNKADNKTINNLDNQLGFKTGETVIIKDVEFVRRILYANDYWKNRDKLAGLIDYWSMR